MAMTTKTNRQDHTTTFAAIPLTESRVTGEGLADAGAQPNAFHGRGRGAASSPPLVTTPPNLGPRVIPVGQEPLRQPRLGSANESQPADDGLMTKAWPGAGPHHNNNNGKQAAIRNPEGFYTYKNRLDEIRVFRGETMRHLRRRAEITVWEAIHNCQHHGSAQISLKRIAELAGVAKRHVVDAIKSLCKRGLLEVVAKGSYRPNGAEGHGLASVYRAYPRPEPRLLEAVEQESNKTCPACLGDRGQG
jgi:hypothetical protein